jgi:acetyltransferase-like isoleucine patch superfamily enzyme
VPHATLIRVGTTPVSAGTIFRREQISFTVQPVRLRGVRKDRAMPNFVRKPHIRFEDPLSLPSRAIIKLYSLWVSATYPFVGKVSNLSIHYTTSLSRRMAPAIKFGNSVMIRKDAWINTFDLSGAADELKIVIDDNSLIGARDVISAKNSIHIERDVIIGTSVLIQDHNHANVDTSLPIKAQGLTPGGTIRIEQGCWIGHGAAIVCGHGELVLGRNSVVAANALVTRSFPPYSVIVGNPARLARQFDTVSGIWVGATGRPVPANENT